MAKTRQKAEHKQAAIYVIASKDDSLLSRECDRLLDRLLGDQDRQTALFSPELDKVEISEVLDELRTLPFLAPKRVVLLKWADKFVSTHRDALEKYFDNPCPTGVLILTVNTWLATTRLAKKLTAVGELISISEPKAWELPQKICAYAAEAYAKTIAKSAAELLVEIAGDDLSRLYGEIDKLALYVNDRDMITAEDVESLVGHNRVFNAFAVIDAISVQDMAGAIDKLRRMFAADRETEYTFVGAFAYHFRRLFSARALADKGLDNKQIAGKLNMWRPQDSFFSQVRRMPLPKIAEAMKLLAQIDHDIKTGRAQPQVAAEQLVFKLAAERN